MANDVTVRMSAENAEMVRAWLESLRGPQAFSQELDRLAQKGGRAGKAVKSELGDAASFARAAASEVGKFVAEFTGIGSITAGLVSIAQLLRQEWEAANARQKEAATAQVSFGKQVALTQDVFLKNPGQFNLAELAKSARENTSGVAPEDLVQSFREASGEAGDYDLKDIWKLTELSGQMAPHLDVASRTSLVRASLGFAKEFDKTPEEAMAGTLMTFGASNAKDVKSFADNVAPTIVDLHKLGGGKDSFEDLAEFALTWNTMTADDTGQRGRTGMIQFMSQLREEALTKKRITNDQGLMAGLAAVQQDEAIQKHLLGPFAPAGDQPVEKRVEETMAAVKKSRKDKTDKVHLKGEKQSFATAMDVLQGGEQYERQRAAVKAKGPSLDQAAIDEVTTKNRERDAVPEVQALKTQRLDEVADMLDKLSDGGAQRHLILKFNDTIRKTAGMGMTDRWIENQRERWQNWVEPERRPLSLEDSEQQARDYAAMLREQGDQQGAERAANVEAIANRIRDGREQAPPTSVVRPGFPLPPPPPGGWPGAPPAQPPANQELLDVLKRIEANTAGKNTEGGVQKVEVTNLSGRNPAAPALPDGAGRLNDPRLVF